MEKLAGKVAVITGGGGGIGGAVAMDMAAEGAKIVVNDFGKDENGKSYADIMVEEIKKAGGTAVSNYDSISSMESGQAVIKTAIDNFGRIDILVNTAGNFNTAPTPEYTEEAWDAIMAVHLKGVFGCIQSALKYMIPQKSGRIINFTSIAAYTPFLGPGAAIAYCAAKGGVMALSRMLSIEMSPYGITVNTISPTASTILFNMGDRGPKPEFVASVVAYLCTDEAKDITGQIIGVNAGNITVFAPPMGTGGAHRSAHKADMWTMDELIQVMPTVAGIPSPGPGGPPPGGGPPPAGGPPPQK